MKPTLLLLSIFFLFACNKAVNAPIKNTADYGAFKDSVTVNKKQLANSSSKKVGNYLFYLVSNDIYGYWQGTPWTFEGTTRKPREGSIACGYFVTNTLVDLGFKINNVKLAQCISGDMIKALCVDIHSFNGITDFEAYMAKQPVNSVYIVGLDYHTGYVVKDTTGSYFLHSNYINHEGVVKEKIGESRALANNKFFMIGSLSGNKERLRKWVSE